MEEDLVVLEEFFKDRMDVEEEKWALERLSKTFRLLNSKLIHLSDEEYRRVIENAQKDLKEELKSSKEAINTLTNKLEKVVEDRNQLKEYNRAMFGEQAYLKEKIRTECIPISVIQNKIDELEKEFEEIERKLHPRICEPPSRLVNKQNDIKDKIQVLQELLEERNK